MKMKLKKITMILATWTLSVLSACSAQLLSRDQVSDVNLLKVTGRVVRYRCDGSVESDKQEVLVSARKWLEWRPEHETELYSASYANQRTGDSPLILGFYKFEVNYESRDFSAAKVLEGINTFEYQYRVCDEWSTVSDPANESRVCLKDSIWEEGEFQINVHYEEKKKSEVTEYRPRPEDCVSAP